MSKEVKRYNFDVDKFGSPRAYESEHGRWMKRADYDALLDENQRLESAWKVDVLNRKDELIAKQEKENDRVKAERDALLAERTLLRDALEQIENANWSSSETATDFAISQAKGLLIGKMKRIASAALQGAQP